MTDTQVQQGDKVSWPWSGSHPSGEVAEVKKDGELAIESNKGNTIKKNADPENPAVHISRPGNDVVKRAHELDIEEKANGTNGHQTNGASKEDKQPEPEKEEEKQSEPEKKTEDKQPEPEPEKQDEEMKDAPAGEEKQAEPEKPAEEKTEQNGVAESAGEPKAEQPKEAPKETPKKEAAKPEEKKPETPKAEEKKVEAPKTGTKRKAEDSPAAGTNGATEGDKAEPTSKKQKVAVEDRPKKAGRPKKNPTEKKEPAKKKQPKKAATEDGQPRRSARNRS
ncbi:hypothetical protein P154DRAFT_181588 [Amniculicola lignicola CBS 123094]|uniref:Hypervirulence associated protein TUDOR domain-containing protein n=1 Tax=Amniculicola lignicola CBS 123094 TaxID=1392246 RepID=A0A6A5WZA3_9PLEO|nr:hypothetical protein P154DRAFT_181588 [Amniculicola lignicola CBS 123094]